MRAIYLITFLLLLAACSSGSDRNASYNLEDGEFAISIELPHMHPYLAEYERELVIHRNGKEVNRKRLFPDTGGYMSANLYKCNSKQYRVKDYFDSWIVDLERSSITEGDCSQNSQLFVGAFLSVGSKPWQFYTAAQRKEEPLEARGGG